MPEMGGTIERFAGRAENYSRFRPGYPAAVVSFFRETLGLTPEHTLADIGSGTGFSARQFLENGNTVYCVEPNDEMRVAAESELSVFPGFRSVKGTALATGLPDNSVDFVIAAQAFHWFADEGTKLEFGRILRPSGHIVLMWNERRDDASQFMRDFEQMLLSFESDYANLRHGRMHLNDFEELFGRRFAEISFYHEQSLDVDGLEGLAFSFSYLPRPESDRGSAVSRAVRQLFAKHARQGRITVFYETNLYYTSY